MAIFIKDDESFDRLLKAVLYLERIQKSGLIPTDKGVNDSVGIQSIAIAQVTNRIKDAFGFYPAKEVIRIYQSSPSATDIQKWPQGQVGKIHGLNNETLVAGQRYLVLVTDFPTQDEQGHDCPLGVAICSSEAVPIRVTSATADTAGWPATLWVNNYDGTWSTGPNIRMSILPSGGTALEVGNYLAVPNGTSNLPRIVTDGVTTSGSPTLTSATAAFTSDDNEQPISGTGIPAGTTILSVDSSTSVTLSNNATATGSGVSVTITRVYPLYFQPHGNDLICVETCNEDGDPAWESWSIPGPVKVRTGLSTDCGPALSVGPTENGEALGLLLAITYTA